MCLSSNLRRREKCDDCMAIFLAVPVADSSLDKRVRGNKATLMLMLANEQKSPMAYGTTAVLHTVGSHVSCLLVLCDIAIRKSIAAMLGAECFSPSHGKRAQNGACRASFAKLLKSRSAPDGHVAIVTLHLSCAPIPMLLSSDFPVLSLTELFPNW